MKIKAKKDYDYDKLKAEAKAYIDAFAEQERSKYATNGIHQSHVYSAKLEEARRFLEKGDDGFVYHFLTSELGLSGTDLGTVADSIINAHNMWKKRMAQIENIRISRKRMISNCENNYWEIKRIAENTSFDLDTAS
jgi:hypothetical protein